MARPVITLTTDFGSSDSFVGTMKGVMLGIAPDAAIVDVTHEVPRQDVRSGAYAFDTAYPYFHAGAVHIIVIDPAVGTSRRPIVVRAPTATFVCPDNGVLSYVLAREGGPVPEGELFAPSRVGLPPGWTAHHLTKQEYWRHPVSHTFHGRDIFAPVAAYLSTGVSPGAMGPAIDDMVAFAVPTPVERDGAVVGCVQHVDRFGNLITNIDASYLSEHADVVIEVGGKRVHGLSTAYQGGAQLLGLIGSHDCLEIAVPNGSASEALGLGVGDLVTVRREAANGSA